MTNHPNRARARLARYGAKLRTVDGAVVVEMTDPNDNSRSMYQYRRTGDAIERRCLQSSGEPFVDGSPWEPVDRLSIERVRGEYHPILDPLGF